MYNVQQLDPDVRWHQEPVVDVVFVCDFSSSYVFIIYYY
jgi:hypothetical protein